jgi:hypothetical protein
MILDDQAAVDSLGAGGVAERAGDVFACGGYVLETIFCLLCHTMPRQSEQWEKASTKTVPSDTGCCEGSIRMQEAPGNNSACVYRGRWKDKDPYPHNANPPVCRLPSLPTQCTPA